MAAVPWSLVLNSAADGRMRLPNALHICEGTAEKRKNLLPWVVLEIVSAVHPGPRARTTVILMIL